MKTNLMDQIQSLAQERQGRLQTVVETPSTARGLNDALNQAADPGKDRLGWYGALQARHHESKETLATTRIVISEREKAIRNLGKDSIVAEMKLLSAKLKTRFDTEFGVVQEQGLAVFTQAQRGFNAVVDAAIDILQDDLFQRVHEQKAKLDSGRISTADFESEMDRIVRQRNAQVARIEASCDRKLRDLEGTFTSN